MMTGRGAEQQHSVRAFAVTIDSFSARLALRRCRWCRPGRSLVVPVLRLAAVWEVSVPFRSNSSRGRLQLPAAAARAVRCFPLLAGWTAGACGLPERSL